MEICSGFSSKLGASFDGEGTNFALFSAHAEAVELCLFDPTGSHLTGSVQLPQRSGDVWHGYLPNVGPGTCYGYRVHGKYEPSAGYRFNANKLLLDPYARQLKGNFAWHESHFGYTYTTDENDSHMDERDNANYMPKAVVVADQRCESPRYDHRVPWHKTVLYETHVRGFTIKHPAVSEAERGTFAGLSVAQVVDYIKALGVTSVELMPVHAYIDEFALDAKGLKNYWGYNTLNFFALHSAYLSSGQRSEFRHMVNVFHDAGLEVILDVVYNHTCEGDHRGPTLSFKGIDNLSYYQLMPGDRRFYINDSGCGNTLNIHHPMVLRMVMDSLRYWADEMGVDGFRFDLASVLGRREHGFSSHATFFQALAQDPVLSTKKMIAEPWDLGPGGYQLGSYPRGWSEWNDRYRDSVRRFWKGDSGELPELARRLHGSGDLFEHSGKTPSATINFVTSHDGFTLRDLVSYNLRHNLANGEKNCDGHRSNHSFNHGVEGASSDPAIDTVRWRQQRNMLATLIVSQGVPMLLAGDEFGRTQQGNNNAYCQDNETTWLDWTQRTPEAEDLVAFTRKLLTLRSQFPLLQAREYRHQPDLTQVQSISWLNSDGQLMREEHWHERENRVLGYLLTENIQRDVWVARYLLVLFNGSNRPETFSMPAGRASHWQLLIDTATTSDGDDVLETVAAHEKTLLTAKSLKIFMAERSPAPL